MSDFLNKIIGDLEGKKEWKAMEARAKLLPEQYKVAYDEIKSYIWKGGAGMADPTNVLRRLLEMFEEAATTGKSVLEITGTDVATFLDELARDEKKYSDKWREELNQNIAKKLGK